MLLTFTPTWLAAWTIASLVAGVIVTIKVQKFFKNKLK